MYGLWLLLWYLQTFGHCSLSLNDVRLLITPVVSSNCLAIVICSPSMYGLWLPGNHNPYIDGQTTRVKNLKIPNGQSESVYQRTIYNGQIFEDTKGVIWIRTCTDYDYPFGIFNLLAIVVCHSSLYGFWLPKVWRCQRSNHSPYIEGETAMAKSLKIPKG
jgi:hypothetical protein